MNAITVSFCLVVIASTVGAENPKCLELGNADFPGKCAFQSHSPFCCEDPERGAIATFDRGASGIQFNCECQLLSEICKTNKLECHFLESERRHMSFDESNEPSSGVRPPSKGSPLSGLRPPSKWSPLSGVRPPSKGSPLSGVSLPSGVLTPSERFKVPSETSTSDLLKKLQQLREESSTMSKNPHMMLRRRDDDEHERNPAALSGMRLPSGVLTPSERSDYLNRHSPQHMSSDMPKFVTSQDLEQFRQTYLKTHPRLGADDRSDHDIDLHKPRSKVPSETSTSDLLKKLQQLRDESSTMSLYNDEYKRNLAAFQASYGDGKSGLH